MRHPFIVAFLARSGSTAIFGNLRKRPDVVMEAEVFGGQKIHVRGKALEQNDDNRIAFLRRYWQVYRRDSVDPSKAIGLKIQFNRAYEQFSRPNRLAKVACEYDPRIILLRRNNVVKQAISSLNARRLARISKSEGLRHRFHVESSKKEVLDKFRREKFHVDPAELGAMCAGIEQDGKILDEFGNRFPSDTVLDIRYEDYLADPLSIINTICEFIGADTVDDLEEEFVKITPDHLANVIENFEELDDELDGTYYHAMLHG